MVWNTLSKIAIAQTFLFIPALVVSIYLCFHRHRHGLSRWVWGLLALLSAAQFMYGPFIVGYIVGYGIESSSPGIEVAAASMLGCGLIILIGATMILLQVVVATDFPFKRFRHVVNALPLALLLVADALLLTGLSLSMDYDMSIEGFAFILAGCILIATLFGTIIALQGWLWLQLSRLSRDGSTKMLKGTTIATPFILVLMIYIMLWLFSDTSTLPISVGAFIAMGPVMEYLAFWSYLAVGLAMPPTPKQKVASGPEGGVISKTEREPPAT